MPRFSSKLQGEFSLKPVGFECFNSGKNILACQKIDNVLFMVYLKTIIKGQIMSISNHPPLKASQVADYFLRKIDYSAGDSITNLKLQKLCYFSQACSLYLKHQIIFEDKIEAWAHGPVVPNVYKQFRKYKWTSIDTVAEISNSNRIDPANQDAFHILEQVWRSHGQKSARALEHETHQDTPWIDAYGDRSPGQVCNEEITPTAIKDFYKKQSVGRIAWQENADVRQDHHI